MRTGNNLRAYVDCPGDRSVGIAGSEGFIDFGVPEFGGWLEGDMREWVRKRVGELFMELHDNGVPNVAFSDECKECGRLLCKSGYCKDCFLNEL